MDDIKKKLDDLVKNADYLIANPSTIENLKSRGLPIESRFITYKDYLDRIFKDKRKFANSVIDKFPPLNKEIANSTIEALYEEVRECFLLGIPGASITLASILLELSLKYRLFNERLKSDPKSIWSDLEKRNLSYVIKELFNKKIIDNDDKLKLNSFDIGIRNNYAHYKIENMMKDMIIEKLPSINIETGEVIEYYNVKASENQHLWFSGKKVLDKKTIIPVVNFCIGWVNKILLY